MCFNVGWLVISHLVVMIITLVGSCPINCVCMWKGGKEWVECANRGYTRIPEGVQEVTQVLDLSGNHLVVLQPKCFQSLGLTNLQKLYLAKSNISQISQDAFVGLVGLVELDLHENLISHIAMETFQPCYGLMRLILNSNPLEILKKDSFKPLSLLTTLELSQCQLISIEQGAFNGLHSLEWLKLDRNQLTYVPEMTLPLGTNLHGLTLHNNPWLCNCRLRALKSWLEKSSPNVPQESEPTCQAPRRLNGKQIKQVKLDDLACLPQVKLDNQMEVDENSNVTLTCYVYALPPATVTWFINGEKCGTHNENDSFIQTSNSYLRYTCKQRGQFNVTNNLYVYGADKSDEGIFTCNAENTAGSVSANLSLRVRLQERSTVEPVFDNPKSGYIAVIAAGALVGTLLALSCVIGSVIFCIKRHRNQKRNNSKDISGPNKIISPITKNMEILPGKNDCRNLDNQQNIDTERDVVRTSSLDRRDTINSYRNATPKYLIEPDLINEVYPTANQSINDTEHYNLFQLPHQHQLPESRRGLDYSDPRYSSTKPRSTLSHLSYLDHDGYPLNFGLPKIPFNANCTLPRLRQRLPDDSAASPAARYSREAEFLARSNLYNSNVPRTDTRYTVDGYIYPVAHQPILSPVRQPLQIPPLPPIPPIMSPISPCALTLSPGEVPFIPSPPAAYRSDIPLSPRSLLSKTAQEAAAAVAARGETIRPPDHPESPDEGYVGDAMDV